MQRAVVGFDLDSVVADNNDLMAAVVSKEIGRTVDWRDWNGWSYYRNYGISDQRFLEICIEGRVLEDAPLAPGALEAMLALKDAGLDVACVTARAYHPRGEQVTGDWIDRLELPVDRLVVLDPSLSKRDALLAMPEVVAYLDDYLSHLYDIAGSGHPARLFVMDQPWNVGCRDFTRIFNLPDYAKQVLAGLEPVAHRRTSISLP